METFPSDFPSSLESDPPSDEPLLLLPLLHATNPHIIERIRDNATNLFITKKPPFDCLTLSVRINIVEESISCIMVFVNMNMKKIKII